MPNFKSSLFLILSLFLGFQSIGSTLAHEPYYVNCEIVYPWELDSQGRTCNQMFGIKYGAYGPFISPACWATQERAVNAMYRSWACTQPLQYGRCSIIFPLTRDNRGAQCYTNQFGVTYEGTILQGSCFNSLELALRNMQNNPACY